MIKLAGELVQILQNKGSEKHWQRRKKRKDKVYGQEGSHMWQRKRERARGRERTGFLLSSKRKIRWSDLSMMGCRVCTLQKPQEQYKLLYEVCQVTDLFFSLTGSCSLELISIILWIIHDNFKVAPCMNLSGLLFHGHVELFLIINHFLIIYKHLIHIYESIFWQNEEWWCDTV